jgi:hypothetical protein
MKRLLVLCCLVLILVTSCDTPVETVSTGEPAQTASESSALVYAQTGIRHAFMIDCCAQAAEIDPITGYSWFEVQRDQIIAQLSSLPANAQFNVFAIQGDGSYCVAFAQYRLVNAANLASLNTFFSQRTLSGVIAPNGEYELLDTSGDGMTFIHMRMVQVDDTGGSSLIQCDCPCDCCRWARWRQYEEEQAIAGVYIAV